MLKKLKFAAVALLLPLLAFAQSYPSPTFNNVTVQGTLTAASQSFTSPLPVSSGGTGLAVLTQYNVVVGNGTSPISLIGPAASGTIFASNGASAYPSFQTKSALGLAASGANSDITSLSGLSTALSVAQGGTGSATQSGALSNILGASTVPVANGGTARSTLTAHSILLGNGTSGINSVGPCATTGQSLIGQGASADPICGYPTGTLIGFQRFTSSGTYTPSAGTNSVIAECLGAGGAGGGAVATGAGQISVGGGGNAGAYTIGRFTSGYSGITVTIGAAGVGAAGAAGGNGGNTTFGALLTANGGTGGAIGAGATATPTISLPASTAATASGGNIANVNGSFGEYGESIAAALNIGGKGASSQLGSGGYPGVNGSAPTAANGFGAGGAGAANSASTAAQAGSSASPGVCLVYEYN